MGLSPFVFLLKKMRAGRIQRQRVERKTEEDDFTSLGSRLLFSSLVEVDVYCRRLQYLFG